jgi:lia operon protein LiaF
LGGNQGEDNVRKQQSAIIGLAIIAVGLVFLIGTVFRVNVWAFCWPIGLIAVGVWLLIRPAMVGPDTRIVQRVLGDIRRDGAWDVVDEEIWLAVGDVRLDLTEATVPAGETNIRVYGLVGDVRLIVPEGVGVSVSSWAFVSEGRVFGQKEETYVTPLQMASDDYETTDRKVRVELYAFVNELSVRRG